MKRLTVGLLAVVVSLACVASLCLGDNPDYEAGFDVPAKTEKGGSITGTGSPIKIVPEGEVHGGNAVPVKLIPVGKAPPAGGTKIETVFVPWGKENLPPENLPENLPENVPENLPPDNIPPENVPPEKPPEAPLAHIELIPNPILIRLARAEPENLPGVKLKLESEVGDLKLPENIPRLMPAPKLPDNATQVRLIPAGDVPLPENTVSVKTTEN